MARKRRRRKKRGIFKKILRGIGVVGGSILGAVTGISAIKGVVKGTGALAGIAKGLGGLKNRAVNIGQTARKLITGTTKAQRQEINAAKQEGRDFQSKLAFMDKLMKAGKSENAAAAIAGVILDPVTEPGDIPGVKTAGFDIGALLKNPIALIGAGLLVLLLVFSKFKK